MGGCEKRACQRSPRLWWSWCGHLSSLTSTTHSNILCNLSTGSVRAKPILTAYFPKVIVKKKNQTIGDLDAPILNPNWHKWNSKLGGKKKNWEKLKFAKTEKLRRADQVLVLPERSWTRRLCKSELLKLCQPNSQLWVLNLVGRETQSSEFEFQATEPHTRSFLIPDTPLHERISQLSVILPLAGLQLFCLHIISRPLSPIHTTHTY